MTRALALGHSGGVDQISATRCGMAEASDKHEVALWGGQTVGVVRVGDTVRRPTKPNSESVHRVLRWLARERAAPYVPEVLGIDDQSREVFLYIHGEPTWVRHHAIWGSDGAIEAAGRLVRRFHTDVAAYEKPTADDVVLCHGDLGPWNVVRSPDGQLTFIDWDGLAHRQRLWEAAFAAWAFVPLMGANETAAVGWDTPPDHGRRLARFCRGYGLAAREIRAFFQELGSLHDRTDAASSVERVNRAFVRDRVEIWQAIVEQSI